MRMRGGTSAIFSIRRRIFVSPVITSDLCVEVMLWQVYRCTKRIIVRYKRNSGLNT